MAELFPCNEIAEEYFSYVKTQITLIGRTPQVKLFLATENEDSRLYSRVMIKKFKKVGIDPLLVRVDSPSQLEENLLALERDSGIVGGFIFYPINFPGFKDSYFMRRVPEFKDIEGLSAGNVYRLAHYERTFEGTSCKAVVPCTAKSVVKVLMDSGVEISMRDAVIINKSYSVGAPLRRMLDNLGATVVACDINTKLNSLRHYLKNADIVVTAVPFKTEVFDDTFIKDGASVIDISYDGNFDVSKVSRVAGRISSRETGNYIGSVTTSMAAVNVLYLFLHQIYLQKVMI